MITTTEKLTFKSISGNRYRCNQTNKVVKNPEKYRFIHAKMLLNQAKQKRQEELKKILPPPKPRRYSYVAQQHNSPWAYMFIGR